jgi:predicted Zn-dependent protease
MSRWRSGADGDGGDPWLVRPSERIATVWPSRRGSPAVVVLLIIVVVGAAGSIWYSREQHRPPPRVLPTAIHPNVTVVPIGEFPANQLEHFPHDYAAAYGLTITIAEPIELPAGAFDARRQQYVGQDLVAAVNAAYPRARAEGAILVGVTAADLYIRGIDWNWAFALSQEGSTAVISVARMPSTKKIFRWKLFATMMTRQLGFLCFGLPPSDNPYDVLYRDILSAEDLDRVFDQL